VFRSLKSELGLRPVYHIKPERVEGHLFITVLAYQCVQLLRHQLGAKGIHESWATLRKTLSVQRRTTTTMTLQDGRKLHVRKTSKPAAALAAIYDALGINHTPGGIKKTII
jgi:transposase